MSEKIIFIAIKKCWVISFIALELEPRRLRPQNEIRVSVKTF